MLAWGMVGLLGAALARRRRPIPRLAMALICAAAGFGYGLVLNFSTWVTFTGEHTLAQFLLIEGQAFTFDLAHAVGNFVFFLAFGPALVRALRRFRLRMDVSWGLVGAGVADPARRPERSRRVPRQPRAGGGAGVRRLGRLSRTRPERRRRFRPHRRRALVAARHRLGGDRARGRRPGPGGGSP